MENKMFCYQCQETAGCKGCTVMGVCGKKPEVAAMQDLLIYATKGLSAVTTALRAAGKSVSRNVNHLVTVNLFTTITNANFDRESIIARIKETLAVKADLLTQLLIPPACRKLPCGTAAKANSMPKPKPLVSWQPKTKTSVPCGN